MLEFNSSGLLVPPFIINSTRDELEEYFSIDSPGDIRKSLFNQYVKYTNDLKQMCGQVELKQWIDGSFVTKKPRPFDIDLVTFISLETAQVKEKELKDFIYPASSVKYGVDGYIVVIYPDGHKLNFAYQADCSYWINQFDKTKPTKKRKRIAKGFLEIIV